MKKSLFILAILLTIISCTMQNNHNDENIVLIENYVKAVENLDYSAMDDILDENYLGLGPSHNDSITKNQAVENWKKNVNDLYQSISYKKSKNIAVSNKEGEFVSNWAELLITYKKDQKSVTILANTVYQISNGKIIKSIAFYNEADVLEQLGYVFINPNDL